MDEEDLEGDGNMWSSTEFADHLIDEFGSDIWKEKIWP